MLTVYGAIASICAMWMLHATRYQPINVGYMSTQWLAEYRARHFD
jgi:hypothetical protein